MSWSLQAGGPAAALRPRRLLRNASPQRGASPSPEPLTAPPRSFLSRDSGPSTRDTDAHGRPCPWMAFPEGVKPAGFSIASPFPWRPPAQCFPGCVLLLLPCSLTCARQGFRSLGEGWERGVAGLLGRLGPCTGTRKAQHHPSGQLQPTCPATDSNLLDLAQGSFAARSLVWRGPSKGSQARKSKRRKRASGN